MVSRAYVKAFFKVENLDVKVISLLLLICTAAIIYHPVGIYVPYMPYTVNFYNQVDKLKPGDNVLFVSTLMGGEYLDGKPGADAVIYHLLSKPGVKVIFTAWGTDFSAGQCLINFLATAQQQGLFERFNKVYGRDWVQLNFILGGEGGAASFAENVWGTAVQDIHGTPMANIPMMANIHTAKDFALVVAITASADLYAIRQFRITYGIPLVMITVPIGFPATITYYSSGLILGVINGQRGGAEYEEMVQRPGFGLQVMDGINITHLIIVGAIIAGNIVYWNRRLRTKTLSAEKMMEGGKR